MGTLRPPYQQKDFFRPIGAFFLLKLKVTKIPIRWNGAKRPDLICVRYEGPIDFFYQSF